jgi:hypothetical protein
MASSAYTVTQVACFFKGLNMSKYTHRFLEEGFDTLDTLFDIWESDL